MFGAGQIRDVRSWVGREALLRELTAELLDGRRKVLALVGQGGIGKTSLAVKLLEACGLELGAMRLRVDCKFDRLIYIRVSEGMSFEQVVVELAAGLAVSLGDGLRPEQMIECLIVGLQRSPPGLVVLDNLEDVLRDGRAIDCEWGRLLWALAERDHRSKVVITSREVPKDLADPRDLSGIPSSVSVRMETIQGIDQVASVKLLKQLGLRDCEADLEWVAQRVDGQVHVLTLLAKWARKPGMLWKRPDLVMQDAKPILREQLVRQSDGAIDLLKRMCVLRVGIEIEGLTFLRFYQDDEDFENRFWLASMIEEPAELLPEEIEETQLLVDSLVSCSLVQIRYDENRCVDSYDLHRVIVEFMQEAYQSELPELMKNVRSFYKSGMSIENPKTLEDLRPLLEAQHFSFQIGSYEEAWSILSYQLEEYLSPWGNWTLLQNLLEQILTHVKDESKARCLGLLGILERNRGNWDEAERLYRQSLQLREELGDRSGIATSIGCLGENELGRGNLENAETLLKQALSQMEELGMTDSIAETNYDLAKLYRAKDNPTKAQEHYTIALQIYTQLGAMKDVEKMENEKW